MNNLTPVVKRLLIINLVVFALMNLGGVSDILLKYFALRNIGAPTFLPFQYFTYMFMQQEFFHLFGNMLGLYVFGTWLERQWGSKRFLFYFLSTGVGAGLLYSLISYVELMPLKEAANQFFGMPDPELFNSFLVRSGKHFFDNPHIQYVYEEFYKNPESAKWIAQAKKIVQQVYDLKINTPTIGASGAVFGVLLAFGMLFPNAELMLLFPPIPIKAKYLVLFYGAYEFYSSFQYNPNDNVAHFAHLSGMLIGYLILRYWRKQNGHFY